MKPGDHPPHESSPTSSIYGLRTRPRTGALLSAVCTVLSVSGCAGLPSLVTVQESFQRKHPYVTILRTSGQLDDTHCVCEAEFHIFYTKPGDRQEHEDVQHYYLPADAGGSQVVA